MAVGEKLAFDIYTLQGLTSTRNESDSRRPAHAALIG
jgi:hypothetical protein